MLLVALPSHAGDVWLCLKNLRWQYELCGQQPNQAVLVCDPTTTTNMLTDLQLAASLAYSMIRIYTYPYPQQNRWPNAPNHIFQHTARFMQQFGQPWLFLEPDAVPVKANWLQELEAEYKRGQKAFMGPIVPDYGHCNGVAVYHPNTPQMLTLAMGVEDRAWDTECAPQMIPNCHRANHLFFHAWGVRDGQIVPYDGEPCKWMTQESLKTIPKDALIVHRDKSLSIVDRFRERRGMSKLSFCVPV